MATPTLGCPTGYRVEAYLLERVDRLGNPLPAARMRFLGALENVIAVRWSRRLRDVSEAEIELDFNQSSPECCRMFSILARSARIAQLRIWRDDVQVWEGELVEPVETVGSSVKRLVARDVMQRLDDTMNDIPTTDPAVPDGGLRYTDMPVVEIAADIITRNLTDTRYVNPVDDSLILDAMVVVDDEPGAVVSYTPGRVAATVGELLRTLGQSYNLDFTVINRSLLLQRRRTTADQTFARLSTEHLTGTVDVRTAGTAAATRGWATTQREGTVEPSAPEPGDDWPGLLASYGTTGTAWGRIDILNRVSDNHAGTREVETAARRIASGRMPPPTEILLPPSGQLTPQAPVSIDQLVPGLRFDFFAEGQLCNPIRQGMRLLSVDVEWTPGAAADETEQVSVEMLTLADATGA